MDPIKKAGLLIQEAAAAKVALNEAKEYFEQVQADAIEAMKEAGIPGAELDGVQFMITSRTMVKWNEKSLRQSLSDEQWAAVTKQVVTTALVEKAVQEGVIPLSVASANSTVTQSKEWLSQSAAEEEGQ
jgi:hypothetical protein